MSFIVSINKLVLSRQSIKLFCKRYLFIAFPYQSAFASHVHHFDANQDIFDSMKRFKTEHRFDKAIYCTITLLNNIIAALNLPNLNRDIPIYFNVIHRGFLDTFFIQRDGFWVIVMSHSFVKESLTNYLIPPCRQQKNRPPAPTCLRYDKSISRYL